MITDFEKQIYNKFLAISRIKQNKPFRLRKDFSGFEDTEHYFYVKRLSHFFTRFKHVDLDQFFESPYHIYEDQWFDLKFYTSQRALKVYTMHQQKTKLNPPDSDEQLYGIRKSLEYIIRFCDKENLAIDKYTTHITGSIPTCLLHLKQCKVTIYTLLGFQDFEQVMNQNCRDQLQFMLGDLFTNISDFRNKFIKSSLAKKLCRVGIDKIRQLQSSSKTV